MDTTENILSPALKNAFLEFANKCNLRKDILYEDDVDEEKCISLLKSATIKIVSADSEKKKKFFIPTMPDELEELQHEMIASQKINEEDLKAMKHKLASLVESIRKEKQARVQADRKSAESLKKYKACKAHIDRLILYLNKDANAKQNLNNEIYATHKLLLQKQTAFDRAMRQIKAKDKYITQLHDCSKLLEGQLRLMDEKYVEMQSKLSLSNHHQVRVVSKATKKVSELRMKYWKEHGRVIDMDVKADNEGGEGREMETNKTRLTLSSQFSRGTSKKRPASSSGYRSKRDEMKSSPTVFLGTGPGPGSGPGETTRCASDESPGNLGDMSFIQDITNSDQNMIDKSKTITFSPSVYKSRDVSLDSPSTQKRPATASGSYRKPDPVTDNLVLITGTSNEESDQVKLVRALTKLRRRTGKSSVDEWTVEKAKMIAYNDGCFG